MDYTPEILQKVNADLFYGSAHRHYQSTDFLQEAGFFDDTIPFNPDTSNWETRWDVNWLTTPIHKIINNLNRLSESSSKYAVLVTMGGFCPIHDGHINMMERAKEAVEQNGYSVLGGYISPSHDKYVLTKFEGTPMLIDHRIDLCERAVATSDWLMVDSWEGRYNTVAINYTDVMLRLSRYLHKHVKVPVDVFCVFGGDNAGFAKAFVKIGHAVCVTRPAWEEKVNRIKSDISIENNKRILWIDGGHAAASRDIRKSGYSAHLNSAVVTELNKIGKPIENINYLIRDDIDYATKNWEDIDAADKKALTYDIATTIQRAFNFPLAPDVGSPMHIQLAPLAHQQKSVNDYFYPFSEGVINLDACTESPYKIEVSRQFELSDGQLSASKLISRPGFNSIEDQIAKIPSGRYTLIDDDIASGTTMNTIKSMLPDNIQIVNHHTLLSSSLYYDVVDIKDFIVGAHGGGLVASLPNGKIARVPYLFPYVSLHSRAKLPHTSQMKFSKQIWKLNKAFFDRRRIFVRDTDQEFQNFALYIGFGLNSSLSEVCQYHIDKLDKL